MVKTTESEGRVDAAKFSDWTVAIEANTEAHVAAANDWLKSKSEFSSSVADAEFGVYQMQHRLNVSG